MTKEVDARLGGDDSQGELNLPYPKKIDLAVPGNRECGRCTDAGVARIEGMGGRSVQGVPSNGTRSAG